MTISIVDLKWHSMDETPEFGEKLLVTVIDSGREGTGLQVNNVHAVVHGGKALEVRNLRMVIAAWADHVGARIMVNGKKVLLQDIYESLESWAYAPEGYVFEGIGTFAGPPLVFRKGGVMDTFDGKKSRKRVKLLPDEPKRKRVKLYKQTGLLR